MENENRIVITGAASGIGQNLAKTLSENGRSLLLLDKDIQRLKDNFQDEEKTICMELDVCRWEGWSQLIDRIKAESWCVTHHFNCAGVIRPGFVRDFDLKDIDFHLDINAKGSMLGTKAMADLMIVQGGGHVINIASLAGLAPVSGLSLYSASKFAIRAFSQASNAEYKPFGVNVSVVCPDLVKTPMLDLQLDYPEEAKLTFSGPRKVLRPKDITKVLLRLMDHPKELVSIPESRGLLAKIAGIWPGLGELFRKSLENKGAKTIQKLR